MQFTDTLAGQQGRIFNKQRTKIFMQILTAIKHFEIYICLLFLLAIADLIHPLSNNRSSIGMIGCFFDSGDLDRSSMESRLLFCSCLRSNASRVFDFVCRVGRVDFI